MRHSLMDIPAIIKSVSTRHQKFVKEYGSAAEKVIADHKLFAETAMAKLRQIAILFQSEKVIDEVTITDNGPYRKVCLSMRSNATYVNISTNGIVIVMEGFTYTTGFDTDFQWPKEKVYGINREDFDWQDFSMKLLDYIHATIYERKEAMEARLNGMFQSSPFENIDGKSKKNKK